MSQTNQAIRITVSGKVQGVCFRAECAKKARELRLQGFVQNCNNGSVFIYAVGPKAQLAQLEAWCHQGSPRAEVTKVQSQTAQPDPKVGAFHIKPEYL